MGIELDFRLHKCVECSVKGANKGWKRQNQPGRAPQFGVVARVTGEVAACAYTSSVRTRLVRVSVRERERAKNELSACGRLRREHSSRKGVNTSTGLAWPPQCGHTRPELLSDGRGGAGSAPR